MITLIIVIITSIISILAFSNSELMYKYQLHPYQVYHLKQYFRIVTHGFLHANWLHLIVNMLVFYSFGIAVERYFEYYFNFPIVAFLVLYFGSMAAEKLF